MSVVTMSHQVTESDKVIAKVLAYFGTVPFWGAIAANVLFPNALNTLGLDLGDTVLAYGAIIASFIAGIHWGIYISKRPPINLLIHSNVIALLAWGALLVGGHFGMWMLLGCFIYLLFLDFQLVNSKTTDKWFYHLRLRVSSIVCASLIAHLVILSL